MLEFINNRLFIHLCKYPHTKSHLRELARQLSISPPKCGELIKQLAKHGLIKTKKEGRNLVVEAKIDERFISLKRWINVFQLLDSGVIQKLSEKDPATIILFGSYAQGMDHERSDIDLAMDIEYEEDLSGYEKILSRKIQLISIHEGSPPTLKENIRQGILIRGAMI
jgi:predicted nucleotidyltransferase